MSNPDPKTVLVLCFSELHRDPRVHRQLLFLNEMRNTEIFAAGWSNPHLENVKYIELPRKEFNKWQLALFLLKLKLKQFVAFYWSYTSASEAYNILKKYSFDIVVANDIESLPLAIKLKEHLNATVIYDAHEYTPREFESSWKWRLLWKDYKTFLCKKYLNKADKWITVSPSIALEYEKVFNIKPIVITNAPSFEKIEPSSVNANEIKIVHHGGATVSRKIENMIEMMEYTNDNFHLYLILVGNPKYQQKLKKLAKSNNKVHFVPPVPMPQIASELSKYDIGLYILEDRSFNEKYALPNKLFEFVQARLMVAIGPSPEMKSYVEKFNLGIVSSDFDPRTMARVLNKLTIEEITSFKKNANRFAKELSAESNAKLFVEYVFL